MDNSAASSLFKTYDDLATTHPILSKHWPDFPPDAPPPFVLDRRLQRDIEKVHRLGPRAIYHLLDEIGCRHSCRTFIEERASRYAKLDPDIVRELGGDQFPPVPLHEVSA